MFFTQRTRTFATVDRSNRMRDVLSLQNKSEAVRYSTQKPRGQPIFRITTDKWTRRMDTDWSKILLIRQCDEGIVRHWCAGTPSRKSVPLNDCLYISRVMKGPQWLARSTSNYSLSHQLSLIPQLAYLRLKKPVHLRKICIFYLVVNTILAITHQNAR